MESPANQCTRPDAGAEDHHRKAGRTFKRDARKLPRSMEIRVHLAAAIATSSIITRCRPTSCRSASPTRAPTKSEILLDAIDAGTFLDGQLRSPETIRLLKAYDAVIMPVLKAASAVDIGVSAAT